MLQSIGLQRFRHDIVTEQQQMGFSYEEMSYLKEQDANNSESESRSVVSDSLWSHGLYSLWNSPGLNTGVGSLSLLQGIFPTQGLNPDLPYCRQIFYQLSHKGNPRMLQWVGYSFSRGSSRPRNQTGVTFISGRFCNN